MILKAMLHRTVFAKTVVRRYFRTVNSARNAENPLYIMIYVKTVDINLNVRENFAQNAAQNGGDMCL